MHYTHFVLMSDTQDGRVQDIFSIYFITLQGQEAINSIWLTPHSANTINLVFLVLPFIYPITKFFGNAFSGLPTVRFHQIAC